jgi:hypothetical protein
MAKLKKNPRVNYARTPKGKIKMSQRDKARYRKLTGDEGSQK